MWVFSYLLKDDSHWNVRLFTDFYAARDAASKLHENAVLEYYYIARAYVTYEHPEAPSL